MKTEIIEQEYQTEWKFPCLAKRDGLVVLFTSERKGTVLIPNEPWDVGGYSDSWTMTSFTPITEPTTIKFIP